LALKPVCSILNILIVKEDAAMDEQKKNHRNTEGQGLIGWETAEHLYFDNYKVSLALEDPDKVRVISKTHWLALNTSGHKFEDVGEQRTVIQEMVRNADEKEWREIKK